VTRPGTPGWRGPELLAEVDMILPGATGLTEVAQRLEVSPAAISRAAYRHGRRDLARLFGYLARHGRERDQ
jgi:hypothetical protein